LQSLTSEEEGSISQIFQESPMVNTFSLLFLEESHFLATKFGKIGSFNSCHLVDKVFIDTSSYSCSYSNVNLTNPSKFDDSPFEILGTC